MYQVGPGATRGGAAAFWVLKILVLQGPGVESGERRSPEVNPRRRLSGQPWQGGKTGSTGGWATGVVTVKC
jgi:hypothetical protein